MEEAARRRLGAVALTAVVDGVEVKLEDLVLRIATVEVDGEHRLANLSLDGRRGIRADEHLLDQLLTDRAAPLGDVVMRVVGDRGARDAAEIDPAVLVKGFVLDGDGRLPDVG